MSNDKKIYKKNFSGNGTKIDGKNSTIWTPPPLLTHIWGGGVKSTPNSNFNVAWVLIYLGKNCFTKFFFEDWFLSVLKGSGRRCKKDYLERRVNK